MMRWGSMNKRQRGATLVEFAIGALVFFTATFGVLEFSRLLWTHNALADAARRGARYAVNQPNSSSSLAAIRNVAVYGNPEGSGSPLVNDLTADKVKVTYQGFGLSTGTVTVEIENYDFNFVVPIVGTTIRMPRYHTTLTGENSGWVPNNI